MKVTRVRLWWLFVEVMASVLTLSGIFLGTTTLVGALVYLGSLVFWYIIAVGRRMWGLMPLNIATTIIACFNIWAAWPRR
jgi:hypothetical protein